MAFLAGLDSSRRFHFHHETMNAVDSLKSDTAAAPGIYNYSQRLLHAVEFSMTVIGLRMSVAFAAVNMEALVLPSAVLWAGSGRLSR